MHQIFEFDWQAQDLIARGLPVAPVRRGATALPHQFVYPVASPVAYIPAQIGDLEARLVNLVGQAKEDISIQLLDYAPLS